MSHKPLTIEQKMWRSMAILAAVQLASFTLDQLRLPHELRDQSPEGRLAFKAGRQILNGALGYFGVAVFICEGLITALPLAGGIHYLDIGNLGTGVPLTFLGVLIAICGLYCIVRTFKMFRRWHRKMFEKPPMVTVVPFNQPVRGVAPMPPTPQKALPRTTGTRYSTTKPMRLTMTVDAHIIDEKNGSSN
jgi:hypothetical protein